MTWAERRKWEEKQIYIFSEQNAIPYFHVENIYKWPASYVFVKKKETEIICTTKRFTAHWIQPVIKSRQLLLIHVLFLLGSDFAACELTGHTNERTNKQTYNKTTNKALCCWCAWTFPCHLTITKPKWARIKTICPRKSNIILIYWKISQTNRIMPIEFHWKFVEHSSILTCIRNFEAQITCNPMVELIQRQVVYLLCLVRYTPLFQALLHIKSFLLNYYP